MTRTKAEIELDEPVNRLANMVKALREPNKMQKINHHVALMFELLSSSNLDPTGDSWNVSWRAGKMLLNRFCIDEDAAFELAGIYSLWTNSNSEGKELLNLFWITYNEYRLCYVVLYCIAAFWDTSFIILFSRTLDPQRHRFCFWTSNC